MTIKNLVDINSLTIDFWQDEIGYGQEWQCVKLKLKILIWTGSRKSCTYSA